MAGHMISKYMGSLNKYQIINLICDSSLYHHENYVDVFNKESLVDILYKYQPDITINCVRLLIDESESQPYKAIYYNSFIPHYLSKIGKEMNMKIIQLSTDCVFSGKKGNYSESDYKDGENLYARTKALGELINDKDLTLRTSYIGPNINHADEELFHWFMMQKGMINGYGNVFWTGLTTLELAKSIEKAIELNITGLYHLVPDTKISKYDLLTLMKKIWKRNDIIINRTEKIVKDKSLMDNRNLITVNDYETMFYELYDWMNHHKELYSSYVS